jgi:hypothetical protein
LSAGAKLSVHHLTFNQVVVGSIPTGLTNDFNDLAEMDGPQTPACVTAV